jgi:hypothetical protein
VHDLAVVTVSTNEARWLRPCLSTLFAHAGDIRLDVVVADNESTDGTRELVESEFPGARVVRCRNLGFAHGNNRALMTSDARYVLFLNPDTETIEGTYADLVRAMDARPEVGLVGVKQRTSDGELWPTIRYFPTLLRALGNALGSERWLRARWAGERELDLARYEREVECDWTSGSFMLVRREALESSGYLDERFFIYSEETDLCYRIKQAGWEIRHWPALTIVHHAGKAGVSAKVQAQEAFARRQYAHKHFSPVYRCAFLAAIGLGYALRACIGSPQGRAAARRALRVLVGREGSPYAVPPRVAVAIRGTTMAPVPAPAEHKAPPPRAV